MFMSRGSAPGMTAMPGPTASALASQSAQRDRQAGFMARMFDPRYLHTPMSVNMQTKAEISSELQTRRDVVTERAMNSYQSDIIPPSTHSNILRSLKFFLYLFYGWNIFMFLYGFFIPFRLDYPYGGLNPQEFDLQKSHILIMVIVLLLPMIRFLGFTWSKDFYHFATYLLFLETSMCFFVAVWWSPDAPLLMLFGVIGLVNICVAQHYFTNIFIDTVNQLPFLVPPSHKMMFDNTDTQGGMPNFEDLFRTMGVKDVRPQEMFDERCGVYGGKDQMSHVFAMQRCYAQAVIPAAKFVPWDRGEPGQSWITWDLTARWWPIYYFDGLIHLAAMQFISATLGIFLGTTVVKIFVENHEFDRHVFFIMCMVFLIWIWRLLGFVRLDRQLRQCMGVAVSEKEWLSYDIIQHAGLREENLMGTIDMNASLNPMLSSSIGPYYVGGYHKFYSGLATDVEQGLGGGRLNLTFMWLCAQSVADFTGASFMGRLCSNLAVETRYMIKAFTKFDFQRIEETRWELSMYLIILTVLNYVTWQIAERFFEEVYPNSWFLGTKHHTKHYHQVAPGVTSVDLASVFQVIRACWFGYSVLDCLRPGHRADTPRRVCIGESILLVFFIVAGEIAFEVLNVLFGANLFGLRNDRMPNN